jgi:hypothetical protein
MKGKDIVLHFLGNRARATCEQDYVQFGGCKKHGIYWPETVSGEVFELTCFPQQYASCPLCAIERLLESLREVERAREE